MSRFQCIADRCEDNCCGDWRLQVDEPSFVKLRTRMTDAGATNEFAEKVILRGDRGVFAELALTADGSCSFRDEKKLCSVQNRFGEPTIPTACAVYPRHVNQLGERTELSGAFSCPEVARLALGAEDAMSLDDFLPETLSRDHRARVLAPSVGDAYSYFLDDVRSAVIRILARRDYPLTTRLAMCAQFASAVGGFFYRDCGAANDELKHKLARELAAVEQGDVWTQVHEQFTAYEAPGESTVTFVASMFVSRLELPHSPRFRALVERVLATYGGRGLELPPPAKLWETYQARRDRLETHFGAEIERYFQNYCTQFWFRNWYTESDNLQIHNRTLFIRLAAIRLLLVGHPDVTPMLDGPGDLFPIAVEVFQTFVRSVEHEVEFLKIVHQAQSAGGDPFARALLLLKGF